MGKLFRLVNISIEKKLIVTCEFFSNRLVPAKMVLDWKALFIRGRPQYESSAMDMGNSLDLHSSFVTHVSSTDGLKPPVDNNRVLNDIDFDDYKVGQVVVVGNFINNQSPGCWSNLSSNVIFVVL